MRDSLYYLCVWFFSSSVSFAQGCAVQFDLLESSVMEDDDIRGRAGLNEDSGTSGDDAGSSESDKPSDLSGDDEGSAEESIDEGKTGSDEPLSSENGDDGVVTEWVSASEWQAGDDSESVESSASGGDSGFLDTGDESSEAVRENLVESYNVGFEAGLDGWAIQKGSAGVTKDSACVHSGSGALRCPTGIEAWIDAYLDEGLFVSGASYSLEVWGRIEGAQGRATAGIFFYDTSGVANTYFQCELASSVYSPCSVAFVAPASFVGVKLFVTRSATGGALCVDDFAIYAE